MSTYFAMLAARVRSAGAFAPPAPARLAPAVTPDTLELEGAGAAQPEPLNTGAPFASAHVQAPVGGASHVQTAYPATAGATALPNMASMTGLATSTIAGPASKATTSGPGPTTLGAAPSPAIPRASSEPHRLGADGPGSGLGQHAVRAGGHALAAPAPSAIEHLADDGAVPGPDSFLHAPPAVSAGAAVASQPGVASRAGAPALARSAPAHVPPSHASRPAYAMPAIHAAESVPAPLVPAAPQPASAPATIRIGSITLDVRGAAPAPRAEPRPEPATAPAPAPFSAQRHYLRRS